MKEVFKGKEEPVKKAKKRKFGLRIKERDEKNSKSEEWKKG